MSRKLNGSVDLLAKAMRDVFTESVETAIEPLRTEMRTEIRAMRTEMRDMESRLNGRIDETNARIDTTNQNMQAQFAQHRKDVADDVRKILKEKRA